jgi:hypothetical protein
MLHLYSLQYIPAVPVIASAPEQIGLLELSVAATGKALPLQLQLLLMDDYKYRYLR